MLRLIRRHPGKLFALTAATLLGVACSDNTTTENSRPEAASSSKVYDANWFEATAKPKFLQRGRRDPVPHQLRRFRTGARASSIRPTRSPILTPWSAPIPFTTNGSTTVPTVIIPFRFVFANGKVLDGCRILGLLQQSPIFQNSHTICPAATSPSTATRSGGPSGTGSPQPIRTMSGWGNPRYYPRRRSRFRTTRASSFRPTQPLSPLFRPPG